MSLSTSAVLIGVNHYPNLGSGLQLRGAANDARAWYAASLKEGSDPHHCAALTSVATEAGFFSEEDMLPDDLRGTFDDSALSCGLATKANIEKAITALIDGIAGTPSRQGLLVFAGHGAQGGDGELLLCPCDVDQADLGNTTVSIAFIRQTIDDARTRLRSEGKDDKITLTIALDTCFAGRAASQTSLRTITPSATGHKRKHLKALSDEALLIMSSKAGESSYEYNFGANLLTRRAVHGVFTSTLMEMLERWRMTRLHLPAGTLNFWPVSYDRLAKATAAAMTALQFDQHSWFKGPKKTRGMPALRANYRMLGPLQKKSVKAIMKRNCKPWTPPGREISGDWTDGIWGNLQDTTTATVCGWGLAVNLPPGATTQTTTAVAFYTTTTPPDPDDLAFLAAADAVPQKLLPSDGTTAPAAESVESVSITPPAPTNTGNVLLLQITEDEDVIGLLIVYQFTDGQGDAQEFMVLYGDHSSQLPKTFQLKAWGSAVPSSSNTLYNRVQCNGEGVVFTSTTSTPNPLGHWGSSKSSGTAECNLWCNNGKLTWYNQSSSELSVTTDNPLYFGVGEADPALGFSAVDLAWDS